MLQRQPVQKLHDDEGLPILLPDFMDSADIGMIQCRGCLRLPLEASQRLRVFGYFVGQKLQGYETVQRRILSLVHHTHATAAQLLDDAVVRDGLADHGWRWTQAAMLGM